MSLLPADLRDTITFVVQKGMSISVALLGYSQLTRGVPAETSLAIAQIVVGGSMLAVAAAVEVMMYRAQQHRRGNSGSGASVDDA